MLLVLSDQRIWARSVDGRCGDREAHGKASISSASSGSTAGPRPQFAEILMAALAMGRKCRPANLETVRMEGIIRRTSGAPAARGRAVITGKGPGRECRSNWQVERTGELQQRPSISLCHQVRTSAMGFATICAKRVIGTVCITRFRPHLQPALARKTSHRRHIDAKRGRQQRILSLALFCNDFRITRSAGGLTPSAAIPESEIGRRQAR